MFPAITLTASSSTTHVLSKPDRAINAIFLCSHHYAHSVLFFNLVFVEKRLTKVHSVSVCIFPSLVTFEPSGQFQVNGTKEVLAIITLLPASWKWVTE